MKLYLRLLGSMIGTFAGQPGWLPHQLPQAPQSRVNAPMPSSLSRMHFFVITRLANADEPYDEAKLSPQVAGTTSPDALEGVLRERRMYPASIVTVHWQG